jgi:SRSO17 transposase
MSSGRTMKNIARKSQMDYQSIHHFMSNSPWKSEGIYEVITTQLKEHKKLKNSRVFIIDDTGNKKSSNKTVGASRQYIGSLGKIDMSQNAVMIGYANIDQRVWNWVNGELYLSKEWFEEHYEDIEDKKALKESREKFGISDREFKTKIEIAYDLVEKLEADIDEIELLSFDGGYGKSSEFREQLHKKSIKYMADVPSNTRVYLEKPTIGKTGKVEGKSYQVNSLRQKMEYKKIKTRPIDRGYLYLKIAVKRVFMVYGEEIREEWLVINQESKNKHKYSICNLNADVAIEKIAYYKAYRYFIERTNQDAKSEFGWDEFRGQKYLAWSHNLAMTILSSWFISYIKLFLQDDLEQEKLEDEFLLLFSVSNIKELLLSVIPFEELTPEEASQRVIEHLINRNNSRKSRLKKEKNL